MNLRAIKINVATQQVEEVTIPNYDYTKIYNLIGNGCTLFCCPVDFENGDALYCDDEGLFQELEGCFWLKNFRYPIVGNAIILGTDEEGESISAKTSVREIMDQIVFGDKAVAENHRQNVL